MYNENDINEYNRQQVFDQMTQAHSYKNQNRQTGSMGEVIAERFLTEKGYKIVAVNYVNKIGEIDIIANLGETIVFVEVKMRGSLSKGAPREAVNAFKQRKIRQVAESFLKHKRMLESSCRFDCIEIVGILDKHTIEHLEGCF